MKFEGQYQFGTNQAGKGDMVSRRWPEKSLRKIRKGLLAIFGPFISGRIICDKCKNSTRSYTIFYEDGQKKIICHKCKARRKKR